MDAKSANIIMDLLDEGIHDRMHEEFGSCLGCKWAVEHSIEIINSKLNIIQGLISKYESICNSTNADYLRFLLQKDLMSLGRNIGSKIIADMPDEIHKEIIRKKSLSDNREWN